MAHSIESRLPFLDHRLAELVFSMEPDLFMSCGKNKFILRAAMEGILPGEVLGRHAKYGFPVPEARWLYRNLHEPIRDLLRIRNLGGDVFDEARLRARFDADVSSENAQTAAFWFRVVSFLLWRHGQRGADTSGASSEYDRQRPFVTLRQGGDIQAS